jgi:galactonate dehydratase
VTLRRAAAAASITAIELVHAPVSPKTTWSFVELVCTDGTRGVGEATMPRNSQSLDVPFNAARGSLQGRPLAHVLDFVDNHPRTTLPDAAIASALEQAVWDLEAQRAGIPVWAALEGDASRAVPLYANINRRTVDRSAAGFFQSASDAVAAGFGTFKIAPFDGLTPQNADTREGRDCVRDGLARAATVFEAIGPDRELYIDCHWRFTPAAAIAAIEALAELRVTWFECPLTERIDAIPAIVRLRSHANAHGMRLAGLEELASHEAFAPWLDAGAYDVVMPDVKYCGGIAELIAIGRDATRRGIACAPHNPTGPVCHAASLAACTALHEPRLLEHQWDETPWFFSIGGAALPRPAGGASALPIAAGLGVALNLGGLDVRRV